MELAFNQSAVHSFHPFFQSHRVQTDICDYVNRIKFIVATNLPPLAELGDAVEMPCL